MKRVARGIVKTHYANELSPDLDYDYNSTQYMELIARNVTTLLNKSLFHLSPEVDEQVSTIQHS
jgi:hypothetical protein